MISIATYIKRFAKVWLYTILTANVVLILGLPLVAGDQMTVDSSLPMALVLAFVMATLGAVFGSFIPLAIFTFVHSKINQGESKVIALVNHTMVSLVGYLIAFLFVSSFSLKNNNVVFVVAIYQAFGIVYLLNDMKKFKQKITE
jgi:putative flippase GtrA